MIDIIEAQHAMLEFVEHELGETGAVIECTRRSEDEGGGWRGVVRTVRADAQERARAGQSDLLALYEIEVDDFSQVVSYQRKFSRVGAAPPHKQGARRWRAQGTP